MISLLLLVLFGMVIGYVAGKRERIIMDSIAKLQKPEAPSGVTLSEIPKYYYVPPESSSIAEPKSPARLRWEEEQKIEAENLSANLGPKQ